MTIAVILIAVCWCDTTVFGQCSYSTQQITAPPCPPFGNNPPLIGRGLNNLGDVVGSYAACPGCGTSCHDSAFFWSEETGLITLPKPDGVTTMRASDINDHRQIVGEMLIPGVAWLGFMYELKTEEFKFLEPAIDFGQAYANAINNNGIAAGSRSTPKTGTGNYNAVIWDTNTGDVIDLGVMNNKNSTAKSVNECGSVTGTFGPLSSLEAFLSTQQDLLQLGVIPKGTSSNANGINKHEHIAGNGLMDPDLSLPFSSQTALWRDGEWDLLGLLPDCIGGGATDLNDSLQVVGRCTLESGVQRPFLWQHGHMIDLNILTPGMSQLTNASAINNKGQILVRLGTMAVLLTPIDVPFADLNYDCTVDLYDLLILLDQWGPVSRGAAVGEGAGVPSADLNGDGVVNVLDLLILLENWSH